MCLHYSEPDKRAHFTVLVINAVISYGIGLPFLLYGWRDILVDTLVDTWVSAVVTLTHGSTYNKLGGISHYLCLLCVCLFRHFQASSRLEIEKVLTKYFQSRPRVLFSRSVATHTRRIRDKAFISTPPENPGYIAGVSLQIVHQLFTIHSTNQCTRYRYSML